MKRQLFILAIPLLFMIMSCRSPEPAESTVPEQITIPTETEMTTSPVPWETTVLAVPTVELTEDEKIMLLKLGMAERGSSECTECIALVMRTVLNRVESDRFGSSIRSVIFAQDQFTPVSDGTYYSAEPNACCYEALDRILYGWDESQGALFYEWCEGESWHSKNLHLLLQHCDTRFYD